MLEIRKANESEYEAVQCFYHTLIDMMGTAEYKPGWEKGIYPTDEYLQESISNKELFVGTLHGEIIGTMIVNHGCNEGYGKVQWPTEAAEHEVMMIHALGILPPYGGRGLAKELVRYTLKYARESGQKVVRLDVLAGNKPAEKLYTGAGFQYIDTIRMFYEDTGWTDYKLYEYPL